MVASPEPASATACFTASARHRSAPRLVVTGLFSLPQRVVALGPRARNEAGTQPAAYLGIPGRHPDRAADQGTDEQGQPVVDERCPHTQVQRRETREPQMRPVPIITNASAVDNGQIQTLSSRSVPAVPAQLPGDACVWLSPVPNHWAASMTSPIATAECGLGVTVAPAAASGARRAVRFPPSRNGEHRAQRYDQVRPRRTGQARYGARDAPDGGAKPHVTGGRRPHRGVASGELATPRSRWRPAGRVSC